MKKQFKEENSIELPGKLYNPVEQARRAVRNRALSPYRKYREHVGDFSLNINGLPYTGVNENNLAPDIFDRQKELYDSLSNKLNNATDLEKQQHLFNMKHITSTLPGDNEPKLQTVNLQGGPDIAREKLLLGNLITTNKLQEGDPIPAALGSYKKANRSLNLNRLHEKQTKEAIAEYNKNAINYSDNYNKNNGRYPDWYEIAAGYGPELVDKHNDDPIGSHNHENAHANTRNRIKNGAPDIFESYDFGDYKAAKDIISPALGNYPEDKYSSEVVAILAGNIENPLVETKHKELADYLEGTLDFYREQKMDKDYPQLFNQYIKAHNAVADKSIALLPEPLNNNILKRKPLNKNQVAQFLNKPIQVVQQKQPKFSKELNEIKSRLDRSVKSFKYN